jgi:hypothetical protein
MSTRDETQFDYILYITFAGLFATEGNDGGTSG